MNEVIYSQHSNITSGDSTRAMGIGFIPEVCRRSSGLVEPRKTTYHHERWTDRWKQYRRTVANGTFGAKYSKSQSGMSEAVWEEINKA